MATILTKAELHGHIARYYEEHFGYLETDVWEEDPAANVRVFNRGDKCYCLHCHILTGVVTCAECE